MSRRAGSVVVLGGAGFLGRRICAALSGSGHRVTAVTRGPARPVQGARTVVLDVLTGPMDELASVVGAADAVINAAGDTWEGTTAAMTASHVPLVERLIEAMAAAPGTPRLVQLGSVHEYGRAPFGTVIGEDHPTAPTTAYGRTKLAGARRVLDATAQGRVDGCVLRLSHVCGPGTPRRSFLGGLAERLRDTAPTGAPLSLQVIADGRDFVDVDDAASAVARSLTAPVSGRVVNIGGGSTISMRELAWLLITAAGFPPELVEEECLPSTGGSTRLDIRLAGEVLGWTPGTALSDSVRRQWETYAQG
ncbi:NAD-dependent epimerase/dehydratase family protein [Streptomyces sulphureus]|uniref:NAD-dependent epimerase/dehydratase family protein n=1 Tax=Streptomyces sulphureus TaxID=47758 RepID=UPI001FE23E80|nr:NAD(P)-dependent oxidoreductase [Streptomyces sulphureus]